MSRGRGCSRYVVGFIIVTSGGTIHRWIDIAGKSIAGKALRFFIFIFFFFPQRFSFTAEKIHNNIIYMQFLQSNSSNTVIL